MRAVACFFNKAGGIDTLRLPMRSQRRRPRPAPRRTRRYGSSEKAAALAQFACASANPHVFDIHYVMRCSQRLPALAHAALTYPVT